MRLFKVAIIILGLTLFSDDSARADVPLTLKITGTLSPDITGVFYQSGTCGGKTSYATRLRKSNGGGGLGLWYIWWQANPGRFVISTTIGTPGSFYWTAGVNLEGVATPGGASTGKASVADETPDVVKNLSDISPTVAEIRDAATSIGTTAIHPLPLASSWCANDAEPQFLLMSQLELIAQGHHMLPMASLPVWTGAQSFDENYAAYAQVARLRLPLTLRSTQWEDRFVFDSAWKAITDNNTTPFVVNDYGTINTDKISLLGPTANWTAVGQAWTSDSLNLMGQLQRMIPNPEMISFLSNNESAVMRWPDIDNDQRMPAALAAAGLTGSKEDRRILTSNLYVASYRAMQQGMTNGLVNQAWKNKARYWGYDAFARSFTGGFAGWEYYGCPIPGQIAPQPLAWDGGSPSYYTDDWNNSTDYNLAGPQVSFHNIPFMLEEALRLNPGFWYEMSVWDGYSTTAGNKRAFYASLGQTYTPQRYAAWIKYGLWLTRPRAVREFRFSTTLAGNDIWPYYMALIDTVDQVYTNAKLKEWWKYGKRVPNRINPSPYQINIPAEYQDKDRWFMLECDRNPLRPWYNTDTQCTELKVISMALTRGTAPDREWLVYTYSPRGDENGVKLTIPDFKDIIIDSPVAGAFWEVKESQDHVSNLLTGKQLTIPSPPIPLNANSPIVTEIREAAVTTRTAVSAIPLPLAIPPVSFGLWTDLQLIVQGHHIIPSEQSPLGLSMSNMNSRFLAMAPEISRLNLPLYLEQNDYLVNYLYNTNPQMDCQAFGNPANWTYGGTRLAQDFSTLAAWCPNPAMVFYSTGMPRPTNIYTIGYDPRLLDALTTAGLEDTTANRMTIISAEFQKRYNLLRTALLGSMPAPAWKTAFRVIGNWDNTPALNRWNDWDKLLVRTLDRIDPWAQSWDGYATNLQAADNEGLTGDYSGSAPQVIIQNSVAAVTDSLLDRPGFKYSMSVAYGGGRPISEYTGRGQDYTADRYAGMAQFGMWTCRPNLVKSDFEGTTTTSPLWPFWIRLMHCVDLVHANAKLKDWWQHGELVPTAPPASSGDYAGKHFWFILACDRNPSFPWNLQTQVKVFALALAQGSAPDRKWLVYAHSPLGDESNASMTIPAYKDITITAKVGGAFYEVSEAADTITEISTEIPAPTPAPTPTPTPVPLSAKVASPVALAKSAVPPLQIDYADTVSAPPGAWVTLWGISFGNSASAGTVSIGSTPIPLSCIQSWSDRRIDFQVPVNASSGFLMVKAGGQVSNTLFFTVRTGNLYFVNPTHPAASDANSGNSSQPWKTLAHGLRDLKPGDALYLAGATYMESLQPSTGGSLVLPVMIKALPGQGVVLQNAASATTTDGIVVDGAKYPGLSDLTFSGLTLRVTGNAIKVTGGAARCKFYGIDADGSQAGLTIDGGNVGTLMAQSSFSHCAIAGVSLKNGASGAILRDCTVSDAQGPEGGFVADDTATTVTLARCLATRNLGDGFRLSASGITVNECSAMQNANGMRLLRGARLQNCWVYGNQGSGIVLGRVGTEKPVHSLVNCTVAGPHVVSNIEVATGVGATLKNTVSVGGLGPAIAFRDANTTPILDHVIVQTDGDTSTPVITWGSTKYSPKQITSTTFPQSGGTQSALTLASSPYDLFQDYSQGDLRLTKSSPARRVGTIKDAPSIDFFRQLRAQSTGAVDLGACEYNTPKSNQVHSWARYE